MPEADMAYLCLCLTDLICAVHILKKYYFLTGDMNEKIRYYYSDSVQLNFSILKVVSYVLH